MQQFELTKLVLPFLFFILADTRGSAVGIGKEHKIMYPTAGIKNKNKKEEDYVYILLRTRQDVCSYRG